MAMESFATPYPVVFHDGEQEHDKGQIGVHSVLTFKRFQALLSQKMGLPANQLSSVFVCRRTSKDTDKRQKLPINENTNFNIILNQHNPIREKDCHFLVSLKKSKKERKVTTRKRNSEAENGDDDGSVSSRSEASPPDERPKLDGSAEYATSRETSSLLVQDSQQLSQGIPVEAIQGDQRQGNTASADVKAAMTGNKKTLLRRETIGHIRHVSPRVADWQNGFQVERQEVVSSPPPVHGNVQRESPLTPRQLEDPRPLDKRPIQDESKSRSSDILVTQPPLGKPSPLRGVTMQTEAFQDRYHDAVPTSPARSAVLLKRNGILIPTGAVNSAASFAAIPISRPLIYPATGMVLPRVFHGSGGVAGTSAALNLQQAQAHYLNVHKQHPGQMHMSPQAFSKLQGVVRGLAAIDSGTQNQSTFSVCEHCYTFKERNINPTPFHLCVHDRVTNGFRGPSPAGPIERPVKRLEAAA